MAMEIRSRAPGKIILCGEHAVVHGSTAVAASINLHTNIIFFPGTAGSGNELIELELQDSGILLTWKTDSMKNALSETNFHDPFSPKPCSKETMELIHGLFEYQKLPEAKSSLASGVYAFIYLYASILGFSGALEPQNQHNIWLRFGDKDLELVNKWAFEGERIIHGKPSGIDNTVSTFGNVIMFKSGELTQIEPKLRLRMLITNTKVERNTKALVAGVAERTNRHPQAMASVFAAVDSISREFSEILQSSSPDQLSIAELMGMNQGLLQGMGVSHSSIDDVLRITSKKNLVSKLTGAGGGGCVLTLLPASTPVEIITEVTSELEHVGFQCFTTEVGGRGLEIFLPN
ncbi:mevalonate kinase isoform X2 [Wolffia australiana]